MRLRYDDEAVELEVTNTGRAIGAVRPGLGHLGMRERAAASGGTVEAGPRERGGFRVRVQVPLARPARVGAEGGALVGAAGAGGAARTGCRSDPCAAGR